jgi:hypothetical protein
MSAISTAQNFSSKPIQEVSVHDLLENTQCHAFFKNLVPLEHIERIEHEPIQGWEAMGRYRVIFKSPMKGKLDFEGREEEFLKDVEEVIRGIIMSSSVAINNDLEQFPRIKKVMGVVENFIQYQTLIEAWKGLEESHVHLSGYLNISGVQGNVTIMGDDECGMDPSGYRIAIHMSDFVQALYYSLPISAYALLKPLLVQQGVVSFWGNKTIQPIQLTYAINEFNREILKDRGGISLSLERSTPVHFESDSSWQNPFNHEAKGIPSYFSLGLSSDTSDLFTRFLGKYLKWTPSD